MESRDLVNVYVRTIRAFNDNDVETIQRQVAPEVRYVFHGQNLVSGVYCGIEGIGELFDKVKALTDGTASFDPRDVLANEAVVMVWGRFRGRRNGKTFETDHAYYYRFDEQDRFLEGHTIPVDQHLSNEFWS
jgi:hypothetical protein